MNISRKLKGLFAAALCAVGFSAVADPSPVQTELEKIFDVENTTTMVEPVLDDNGDLVGHTVILGQDYGPVALSNDFGAVTIDLNGWTIKGADGAGGTVTTAGGNGGAAITVAGTSGADAGATTITVMNAPVLAPVQLWENGPYFAACNVGATKPEEFGYYFWWGDTTGYVRNGSSWDAADGSKTSFEFSSENCPTYDKTFAQLYDGGNGYIDANNADGKLKPEHDAATTHLGEPWRMPTQAELAMLTNTAYCTMEWKSNWESTGKEGYVVKGNTTDYMDKSIFLPAAGYGDRQDYYPASLGGSYWTSSVCPRANPAIYALALSLRENNVNANGWCERRLGFTVRPVRDSAGASRPAPGSAAALVGGNGGKGNPAGKGAPAVVDATGAEMAVTDPQGLVKKGADAPPPVPYLDWDGEKLVETNTIDYVVVTADTATLDAGKTYVVKGEIMNATDGIKVNGTVDSPAYLILCDDAELIVWGGGVPEGRH